MSAPSKGVLRDACEALAARDQNLAKAFGAIGLPEWRAAPPTYPTLCRLITHQQISVTAARAIWARVTAGLDPLTPEAVRDATDDALRALGLSGPKVRHFRSIAEALLDGSLDLEAVMRAGDDDAKAALVSVRGIGPWTAELFILYAKGALDAFPTADLGLMESHRLLSGAESRPSRDDFEALGETWRPYRGVAAHLLWGYIGLHREKSGGISPQA